MWKCGVFWILLGNISATVRLYKTPKRPCEIKKFTVYDSQIWCQQGRAFVRHLDTPPGRRDSSMKKKWKSCLTLYLSLWTGLHEHPASLRCYFTCNWNGKNSSFQNTKTKRLLSPSLRRHGIIYNHGLNKVANRFGILNYLSAYNNNKIISENELWLLAPGSWLPIRCFRVVATAA